MGLLLSGSLDFRFPERPYQRFEGPLGFLFTSRTPLPVDHRANDDGAMTCIYLHLPAGLIEADAGHDDPRSERMQELLGSRSDAACRFWRSSPATAALGLDVDHCPFVGIARDLYMQARGYEFLARALDGLLDPGAPGGKPDAGLTASDIQRLHAARDILIAEHADPPTLEMLGRRVGLSVTRLTGGFRRLFGTSVIGFLQDHRLQIAHDCLSAGRMTVAQAAHAAGYRPSSFSTLFRRRYGVPPNALRRRHL